MRSRVRAVSVFLLLSFGSVLVWAPASGAWTCDPTVNTPVCTEPHVQSAVHAVSEGTGEIIVTWWDDRSGSDNRVFAQCLLASGEIDPTWPAADVDVFGSESNESAVVSDNAGGVIVVRHEWDGNLFRAQRIDHNGERAWGPTGVYVSGGSRTSTCTHTGAPDGEGGLLFAWVDHADDYVRAQRVNAGGSPLWGANGQTLIDYPTAGGHMSVVSDGDGGAIVAWSSDYSPELIVQRIRGSGTPVWGDSGVSLASEYTDVRMVSDGNWGAIAVWRSSAEPTGLRAQRLDGEGSLLWAPAGALVTSASGTHWLNDVIFDGAGGVIVAWGQGALGSEPYVQRLDPDGNKLWGSAGVRLSSTGADYPGVSLASDGGQGVYAAWRDTRASGSLYAQRVSPSGAARWTSDGVLVTAAPGIDWGHVTAADGAGGATVVWTDERVVFDENVYAQHVASDGRLDDQLEDNETCAEAASIAPGDHPGLVLFDVDEDWYRIEMPEHRAMTVELSFAHAAGDVDMTLADGCGGTLVAYSAGVTNIERFTFVNEGATRDFDLRVYLYSGSCNEYDMTIVQEALPAGVAVDGAAELQYGDPLVVQTIQTFFGDNTLPDPGFANGSELDAAYSFLGPASLHLLLAGNLESNWNDLEIFFDTMPEGQNRLRGDNPDVDYDGLNRMGDDGSGNGLTFDDVFRADYYITVTGGDVGGGVYQLFANWAELFASGGGIGRFLGQTSAVSDGFLAGGTNPDGIRVTIDNSNLFGVTFGADPDDGSGVTTGVELVIPLAALGNPAGSVRICAFLNGGSHDAVSNQVLGPLPAGTRNLGEPRLVNFTSTPGAQFFVVNPTPTPVPGPIAAEGPALLMPAAPNPFRTFTVIGFSLPQAVPVQIDVFDVTGRRVTRLVDRRLPAGAHETTWAGQDAAGTEVASGVYFYRMMTGDFEKTKKVVKQR